MGFSCFGHDPRLRIMGSLWLSQNIAVHPQMRKRLRGFPIQVHPCQIARSLNKYHINGYLSSIQGDVCWGSSGSPGGRQ